MQIKLNTGKAPDDVEFESPKVENKKKSHASELRQDLVSGDWVVIATARAKRPEDFGSVPRTQDDKGIEQCLFEDPEKTGQEPDVLIYRRSDGEWTLRVFPNKYPAVSPGRLGVGTTHGPYQALPGVGHHEIVVTRDHQRQLALMDQMQIMEVFDAYQDRYLALMNKKGVKYITIFHNHGKEAGASISHPHSQLMTIPVISPYIKLELDGAKNYKKAHRHCPFCVMAEHESEQRERLVFENKEFVAFCPFASRANFEIWVMPKKHKPYFERMNHSDRAYLAEVFQKALQAMHKALKDPAYNFYVHTSPCDGKDYGHYHWHIEIIPHTSTWAGFELETGIEVSTILPEIAAEHLRKQLL